VSLYSISNARKETKPLQQDDPTPVINGSGNDWYAYAKQKNIDLPENFWQFWNLYFAGDSQQRKAFEILYRDTFAKYHGLLVQLQKAIKEDLKNSKTDHQKKKL